MALSGSFETNNVGGLESQYPNRFRLEWSATQNIGGNYSTVSYWLRGHGGTGGGWWVYTWERYLTINGSQVGGAANQIQLTTGYLIFSGSINVGHDAAGNKTFNINSSGRIYYGGGQNTSNSVNFTLDRIPKPPTISSNSITNYNTTSVTAGGNVTDSGGATITTRGVCYVAGTGTPTTANAKVTSAGSTGSYSVNLTGLSPNTTYTARAYATNSQGTSYGANRQFTTYEAPAVSTNPVTSVTGTTATANGNMSNNGNPDITEKGFVYATTTNPTTANTKAIVAGTATGNYTANLTGLTPSTVYYIRAYATYALGTVYGSQFSFQTVVPATLSTSAATGVGTTTATGHGEVLTDGGGTISERGVVLHTSSNPTTSNLKFMADEAGLGVFTAAITGLTPSVTYFYRSYAINEGGTAYGNQLTLSTDQTAPTQPSNLAPADGIATDDLTPTLSWQYNPGSANDTQKDYQVEVIRQSDSFVMWDSGKVASSSTAIDYNHDTLGTALSYDVLYQWRVKSWNQNDQSSPYSSLVVFKTSEKPTVTIDYPTDSSTIASNTPTVLWTYADPEATTQARYRVRIYLSSTMVHDTGWVLGDDVSYVIPDGVLLNLNTYSITVEVEDADGMISDLVSHTFDLEFLAPTLATVGATQDSAGVVNLAVQLNAPAVDGWYADKINIYKKLDSDINYGIYELGIDVHSTILDDGEDETDWTESGVGTAATDEVPKYGSNSVGLGATGAGTAIYTKTIAVADLLSHDTIQAWVNVIDNTVFNNLVIKIGSDSSNYYSVTVGAPALVENGWTPIHIEQSEWTQVGIPDLANINTLIVELIDVTGAITAGDIRIDQIRLMQSYYEYFDYTTAASQIVRYAVTLTATEAAVTSGYAETTPLEIAFTEDYINLYLLPPDNPEMMVKSFMDGTKPPNWTDKTETKYYQTRGSSKPMVVIDANQKYKEGSLELRFFDSNFNGQGLLGVRSLENIKNFKPLLLRTWWGQNYYVSIDGDLNVQRRPGIGWFVSITFTEINP